MAESKVRAFRCGHFVSEGIKPSARARCPRPQNTTVAARCITCALLLLACVLVPRAGVAQAPPPGVFSEVQTAVVPRVNPTLEPATIRSRVVQVDTQKITAARRGREILKLNLFDDAVVEVAIKRVRPTRSGYFISGNPRGREWGEVRLVVNGSVMVGTVGTPEGKFTIRSDGSGRHVIRQIDPAAEPFECEMEAVLIAGSVPQPSDVPAISSVDPVTAGAFSSLPAQVEEMPTEDGSEIRVLVVYTPAAEDEYGGPAGIEAIIDLMIQSTNQAFEDSGINPRLVLAHMVRVRYAEDHHFAIRGSDLARLREPADGYLDEVHALRNKYAADLVHLVGTGEPSGRAHLLRDESLSFENRAFAITWARPEIPSENIFAHEVGHIFGLRHDRYEAQSRQAIYPYAYGYVNKSAFEPDAPETARWRTLMAYNDRCTDAQFFGGCEWLPRFSNPDQTFRGDPLGIPGVEHVVDPDGPSDARRTINNTARLVGSFRSEACTNFSVTPERSVASARGGRLVIDVNTAPGCLWETSTGSEFLTVASDLLAASSGSVVVEVEANQSGGERNGILTVAGHDVIIHQLATTEGVCGRSPGIFKEITLAAGFDDAGQCDEVTGDHLAQIDYLNLQRLGLRSLEAGDFEGLSGLLELDLGYNQLTEWPEKAFEGLSNLRTLSLDENELTELPESAFAGLSGLENLSLRDNALTGLPDAVFEGLSNLSSLDVGNNRIVRLHSKAFNGLPKLAHLGLDNNRLAELPPDMFIGLSNLSSLALNGNRFFSLPAELFEGLSNLRFLLLYQNKLAELPEDLFDGLASLQNLSLSNNRLASLPRGVFESVAGLQNLSLGANELTDLPEHMFAGLSKLQSLGLWDNSVNHLPAGILTDLDELQSLNLDSNRISDIPEGLFASTTNLNLLQLRGNLLARLPDGLFSGLDRLEQLNLIGNPIDPLPLYITLKTVAPGEFKAVTPTSAPFALVLPVNVSSAGMIEGDTDNLTIPAGEAESQILRATRVDGTLDAVSVDFSTLPSLPARHDGYVLQKVESLPLEILPAESLRDARLSDLEVSSASLNPAFETGISAYTVVVENAIVSITVTPTPSNADATIAFLDADGGLLADTDLTTAGHQVRLGPGDNEIKIQITSQDGEAMRVYTLVVTRDGVAGVCDRTAQIVDAIVERVDRVEKCADVTEEDLAGIRYLSLLNEEISTLRTGDFTGLTELATLDLSRNLLTALPADIFSSLASLEILTLSDNRLTRLPGDVFSGLLVLERLALNRNDLSSLPVGLFAGLGQLRYIDLGGNEISSFPEGIFFGLLKLETLNLDGNQFSTLKSGTFEGLTGLIDLVLQRNRLSTLPAGIFSELTALERISLHVQPLTSLPAGVFSGLSALKYIGMGGTSLRSLPAGIFSGLTALESLELHENRISSLPEGLFSDLRALETLWLPDNRLGDLPDGVFSGLAALKRINLENNNLSSLPQDVFSDLSALEDLYLADNQFHSLPKRVFFGLPSLAELELQANVIEPLPLPLGLQKVGEDQFTAVAPTGAPFSIELPLSISGPGAFVGEIGTVTIPAGAVESAPVGVIRTEGTQDAVSVDIGMLPRPPTKHDGYTLEKDKGLPQVVLPGPSAPSPGPVTGVQLVAGIGQLELSWSVLSEADGYKVQWKSGDEEYDESRQAAISGGEAVSYTITGLTAGTEYTVRVIATKQDNDGPPSEEVTGVPLSAPPAQVTGLNITVGVEQLDVSWVAVSDADGYKVQWKSGEEDYADSRQVVLTGGETNSYTITGLTGGTEYSVRVIATRVHADDGAPSEGMSASPRAISLDQVMGVTVVVGIERLEVSWEVVPGADGYKVQWKPGDQEYDETRQAAISDGETTNYTVTGLTPGTEYTVRVIVTREHADDGAPSEEVTGIPKAQPPAQVTSVVIDPGFEGLEVSWTVVSDADGYKVQWKSGEEDYGEERQAVISGGDVVNYTITGLTAGTEYSIRVIATRENADDSPPSEEVTGTPLAMPASQVQHVEVTAGIEQLDVSWSALPEADGYKVQWKSGEEDYADSRQAVLADGDNVSYTITGLDAGTQFTVRVIATRQNAEDGAPSSEVVGVPKASPAAQVTDVEITIGVERLDVSWIAVSDADGYKVQWKSGAEEYDGSREAVLVDSDTVSYTITGLTGGTEYSVHVIATRTNADDGVPSSEVTGVPLSAPPAQVTGLKITVGVEQLDVSWVAVSDADGYKVQWKSGAEDYGDSRQAVLTGGETNSYTITGLTGGTEYSVRVIATKEHADDGAPSEEVTGIPKAQPPAQVTSVAVEPGFEELVVSWDVVSGADGYKVQWKSGTGDYDEARQVALPGGDTTRYTIINLTADTQYTIRVIATREHADDGVPSEEVTAMPVSPDPDVNSDGMLDGNDALILYHSYASANQLGDGETGGTAESRESLLAGYSGKDDPTDDELKAMIRKANAWKEAGVDAGGDINEDGAIDGDDAVVMYYAYATESLVGDGETGGTERFRRLLLAAYASQENPTDEDLKAMLRRANKLRENFG